MSLITAIYVAQLVKTKELDVYTLNRVSKKGNSPALNPLFAWDGTVEFNRLNPVGLLDDYIPYPLRYGPKNDQNLLLLETASFLYPYGVVNVAGSTDCTLFHISEDLTITFYEVEDGAYNTAQLLQMLVDGTLNIN